MNYNMIKKYYKIFFHSSSAIVLPILVIYLLFSILNTNVLRLSLPLSASTENIPLFNNIYWSFFSVSIITFFIIPLYSVFINYNVSFFKKESVIVRFNTILDYLKQKIIYIFMDTTIFVLFIYILIFSRLIIFRSSEVISQSVINIIICIALNITGFMLFNIVFQIFFSLTGSTIKSFLFSYLFVVYDFLASRLNWPNLFVNRSLDIWPNEISVNLLNLFTMIFILIITITLYIITFLNRDLIIPKENKDAT